jgi:hypothetical protein
MEHTASEPFRQPSQPNLTVWKITDPFAPAIFFQAEFLPWALPPSFLWELPQTPVMKTISLLVAAISHIA